MARDFDNLYHFFMGIHMAAARYTIKSTEGSDRKTIKKVVPIQSKQTFHATIN